MLTLSALTDQAKLRGMPADKLRGILREYLQILILREIHAAAAGKKLYFTGGTYLRLVHGLKRFSEDLDFNTKTINRQEFEGLLRSIKAGLEKTNIESSVKFSHWQNIYAASLSFPAIEAAYNVRSKYSKKAGIVIKIETNRPKWKIKRETELVSGFGQMYPCVCTHRGALFADKVDALVKKQRARHLYDIIFMLSNKYPIDKTVLAALGVKGDPLAVVAARVKALGKAQLRKQAESLRPFLFDESQAELIVEAHSVVPSLIDSYRGGR